MLKVVLPAALMQAFNRSIILSCFLYRYYSFATKLLLTIIQEYTGAQIQVNLVDDTLIDAEDHVCDQKSLRHDGYITWYSKSVCLSQDKWNEVSYEFEPAFHKQAGLVSFNSTCF